MLYDLIQILSPLQERIERARRMEVEIISEREEEEKNIERSRTLITVSEL